MSDFGFQQSGRPGLGQIRDEALYKFPFDEFRFSVPTETNPFVRVNRSWRVKGAIEVSDSESSEGVLSSPVRVYTEMSGSTRVGVIEQANQLRFRTSGSERMCIDSSGNVAIGTTDPAGYKLRVNGDVLIDGKLRGKKLWVLLADTSSIIADVQSEDGSYNNLYTYSGTIYGAYVWNALSAILSDMGKSTSTGRIVCSGQMNSLALAYISYFSDTVRIVGHVCSSSTIYYDISKTATSGTTYIGVISFWM
jgi:hypothetical protein